MQIDNYEEAIALTKKLEESLPIIVRPRKPLLKTLRERGETVTADHQFTVELVNYSGDMGGIMCALADEAEKKERYVVSITHLKIDPNHPLKEEVEAYQRRRNQMLMIQEKKGIAAELLAAKLTGKKKKRSPGFGK
ncbi:hypothetical protein H6F74_20810 [Trichocoleus sp. FACHB-90]|uniref:hypothetical protein n=1 Tax=Cyanophyceae TaxID=3028117 RepID=UPI00168646C6|nr:hypothetical protein [Trichocoleus sp. FACHB-90]MBD1928671.1 hypothetical protein [Trichocoleus sp. FACHB-90]